MKTLVICVAIAAVVILGCVTFRDTIDDRLPRSVIRVLRSPESVDILALDPTPIDMRAPGSKPVPQELDFHGFAILGHAPLATREERKKLVDLVFQGIVRSDGRVAGCFNPRHGVRLVREGQMVDLVICYECLQIRVLGPDPQTEELVLTDNAVEGRVTQLFQAAGLTIAR